jgi:hypothetical protein
MLYLDFQESGLAEITSKRMAFADRAIARTEWPAFSASLTVSRPMPLLAPTIRTVLIEYSS